MKQEPTAFAFNRGIISPLALARIDQKRVALGAETMTNWIARVLGPMSLRPGFQYIGASSGNNTARYLPFVFSTTDTAKIELTSTTMRVWVSDVLITRSSVGTLVTNDSFGTDLSGWTDADEAGATSVWVTGGYMGLTGNGTSAAIRRQTLTVAAADQNVEHALRVVINRGPVTLRVGSTSGDDDYINEATLGTGSHSLAFTPTGASVFVQLSSRFERQVLVDQCSIESSGVMSLTTPWAATDLGSIRFDQSGDIIYCGAFGYQQRKIERRSTRSWSIVLYEPEDGPFMVQNTGPITLTPSALSGNITLTASAPLFRSTNVGSLYQIASEGQTVSASISADNTFTSSIEVTGVDAARGFSIVLSGTWSATVTLQRSFDDGASWIDVTSYTTNQSITYDDGLDNQTVDYRIGVKTGGYTSGTVVAALSFASGSITGVVRITAYSSSTSVSAEVLSALGDTDASANWSEGEWSSRRGYPSAVRFHDGRLWWAGKNGVWGSASDGFESFDDDIEGDSAPINRTIGSGPVDNINWILSMQRMILGAQGAEFSVRSSSLDEPLTPTNFGMRQASTEGSAAVEPARVDHRGIYVQRGGIKVYELDFDAQSYDYGSKDITLLVPELGSPGITRLAVQRQPDTRIHCVRSDGTVMLGIYDKSEDVLAWQNIETDGDIEDVVVLPGQNGSTEDQVYYSVARSINGSTVRYLEKWAKETECRGGTLNKQADSFVVYSGIATTTITGLSHLEGESVVVWADGADVGTDDSSTTWTQTYTVSSGQITLATAAENVVVGLPYTAQWESTKLGMQMSQIQSTLNSKKKIDHLGLVARWVHAKGLRYGTDFSTLYDLPEIEQGTTVTANSVRTEYDEQTIPFPGRWLTDARMCLQAQAPRPCTLLAVKAELEA